MPACASSLVEEADPARAPRARASWIRLALVLAILCTSVVSAIYFETADPLECGEHRDLLDPVWLSLSLSIVALIVAVLFPPRLRMTDKVDELTATALMVTITIIIALYLYFSVVPIC